MTFTLTIALGNDAAQTNGDIAEMLRRVAGQLAPYGDELPVAEDSPIRDYNGNTVGLWRIG